MPTLMDERKYPSTRRGSTAKYYCKKWDDGSYSCNCPGWRFKLPDKPRGCSHCIWFAQDYWLMTIAEATRVALDGVRFDVITTYGRFLYLLRFRAGEMFRPTAPRPEERADRTRLADLNAAAEADRRAKELGVKPWTKTARPNTQPARARREFDEEV